MDDILQVEVVAYLLLCPLLRIFKSEFLIQNLISQLILNENGISSGCLKKNLYKVDQGKLEFSELTSWNPSSIERDMAF